jgi:hypothetical protein
MCKHNIEVRSRSYVFRGKAMTIMYSEYVSVDFVTQHAKRMRPIVIGGLSGYAIFFTFSHKR